MYRYWDGQVWSAATSPNPSAPPPNQGLGQPNDTGRQQHGPGQQYGLGQQYGPGQQYGAGQQYGDAYQAYQQQAKKKSPVGWWIGGGLGLVAIVVVIILLVRTLGGSDPDPVDPVAPSDPSSSSSQSDAPCPTTSSSPTAKTQHPNDGRVHGGPISYPQLGSPWSEPQTDSRVPFGSDVQEQAVETEPGGAGKQRWVAAVLIAQLMAGDGFFTPEQGSQIVARCIAGTFYGDNPVQRHDQVSKKITVDGHDAWYLKSHLTFDIDGLKAKGETMVIVIINAGATSGLYYASIPDNAKQYQSDADQALQKLTVDS